MKPQLRNPVVFVGRSGAEFRPTLVKVSIAGLTFKKACLSIMLTDARVYYTSQVDYRPSNLTFLDAALSPRCTHDRSYPLR